MLPNKKIEKIESAPSSNTNIKNKNKKKLSFFKIIIIFLLFWFSISTTVIAYFQLTKSNNYTKSNSDNSAKILQKYQEISDKITKLNEKDISDPKAQEEVKKLTQEINELRILNPYYQFKTIKAEIIPTGVPEKYGQELSLSFDKVQKSMDIMGKYDPTYGKDKIELMANKKERYIKIGLAISCEYCCGVEAIVKENGEAACGCAHSQAMRGLTAYLLKNYDDQYSDEEILGELATWKATYFPKQTIQKVLDEKKKAGEEGIAELLNEFPEFLPDMVGGC